MRVVGAAAAPMFESRLDQASGLRRLFRPRGLRLLPLVSDPRPAVSSVFALNLAAALARGGSRPIVIDAHREGVPALVGLERRRELQDLLEGRCHVGEVLRGSVDGVAVLRARRGAASMIGQPELQAAVFSAIGAFQDGYDVALFHAPAALLGAVMPGHGADTTVLCGPHEDDLTSTYGWLKAMVRDHGLSRFRVVFDTVDGESEFDATARHRRLADVAARFLEVEVAYGGTVCHEPELEEAVRLRASVFALAADGPCARAFERIATGAQAWRLPAFEPAERRIH